MSAEASPTQTQCVQTKSAVGRRDLLLAFVGLCAGLLTGPCVNRQEAGAHYAALGAWLRNNGAAFLPDLKALSRLGAIYLVAHPQERSPERLSDWLIGGDGGVIASRIRSAVARDWSGTHIVVVDGWLLARTEARLCALLHLEERTLA